ncbi:hypothetical protein OSB04_016042 [Centaurea solstitialis]|uniref:Major facilitator superfamily (MFS) profile domain-containing protein n=1 Tax=Centaurea solstitialis TaxID=347529 RepID=A0AA38TIC9_9ASTR|nr:hypothetical protein OSB04_016042 [Centaurea solstitialis]
MEEGNNHHSLDGIDLDNDSTQTSWFTPKRLLLLFCVINLITYLDRGAIASTGVNGVPENCDAKGVCSRGTGIQGDFRLNNAEDGILSSAFMVGLLLASPVFASLAKSINPFRLIAVGLSVWTSAAVGCGFSVGFWTIVGCRMLVGVGEASFISLAAPFIDDNAPVSQRSAWLGIFYMCIPTGVALGYVYGGLVGDAFGWRQAFFGEAIMMVPFVILCFVMKPVQLKAACSCCRFFSFFRDVNALLHEKIYVVNVLGYIAYNFVIGAYSYWGPKAGYSIYNMSNADMMFGAVTIVGGIVGTLGGGFVLDRLNSTIHNAFKLLSISTFLGAICCFSAFCFKDMNTFIVLFLIGEILVFATQGPVNFVSIHSVKPSLRPLSMAMSTVAIHIFGDVPSSPLVGIMQDKLRNWRKSTLILSSVLFLAAGIWFIGVFLGDVSFDEEDEETGTERSNTTVNTTAGGP